MVRVLLLGDYFNGLLGLAKSLDDTYNLYKIAFFDITRYNDLHLAEDWEIIDFRDFHELTIRLMDIQPDIVIYLSSYNRRKRCALNPELAYLANTELLEHLHEVLSIHASHLIVLIPNSRYLSQIGGIMIESIEEGKQMVRGMGKMTYLEYHEIIDRSPEGYFTWTKLRGDKIETNNLAKEVSTVDDLANDIIRIIDNSIYGEVQSSKSNLNSVTQIEPADSFTGDSENFD